ncbi:acyl-CoA thioesterase [Exiguobacterium profundum]|jgi:acyl-CoA thioester hydrolase|uniref:Thioesterase superfamily protein n=2 Tax=Exiguobacterium TaxID=33986 RepID=C4L2R2_EXISA|nr:MULTISPECIES: thioesterase family protein [Exiguobacterium]QPI68964.1 acyl-CoA thioesterase [Exiguobacterium sp. PBE]ACQ69320.1 thioesterase superfamily protein [Exiguobacterium sp. AT1b]MBG0917163.1 acyl-CoA thioesterase [Exiguobacterium sp. SRB7LM]MBQ6460393.1 acyl-CoA thioesterase [Exiguobacterium sp.]MCT4796858.1 acyl-CoA thioesterase [Exiguobacterium profundum]
MHTVQIPVRYQETDMMGIVYHANYLVYLEIARTELLRQLGVEYKDMEEAGFVSPVTNVSMDYKRSVTYGDTVHVRVWVDQYSKIRTIYGYELTNQHGELVGTATTTHVVVKRGDFKPIRLDREFPKWHEMYLNVMNPV